MRIALSIGHGLNDPGAVSGLFIEHLEAYKIAWLLRDALTTNKHTVELISCFQELPKKINSINELHNVKPFNLTIEIHFNSHTDPKANGTEVLYYSPNNQPLAAKISAAISRELGTRDRGAVKPTRPLGFLRQTQPPALIIEVLFISSPVDTSAINITFHRRVAESIAGCL